MIAIFIVFTGVVYACAAYGLPLLSAAVCLVGMILSLWIGLGRCVAEDYDRMGRRPYRPPMRLDVPVRQRRYQDEEE